MDNMRGTIVIIPLVSLFGSAVLLGAGAGTVAALAWFFLVGPACAVAAIAIASPSSRRKRRQVAQQVERRSRILHES